MLKSFAKNSLIYTFSNFFTRGISFFLLPLYTAILTSENYGTLELVTVLSSLIIILFTFQINQGIARYFNELKSVFIIQLYSSTVFFFVIASFTILFGIGIFFKQTLSSYLSVPEDWCFWIIGSISLNGIFYITRSQLTWKLKPIEDTISGLAFSLTVIFVTIFLLVFKNSGLVGVFIAQCLGAIIGIICSAFFMRMDLRLYFSFKVIYKLLSFSISLIPSALSVFLFLFIDRIFIKEMMTLHDLGIYSVAFKVGSILTLVSLGIGKALTPIIYKHFQEAGTAVKLGQLLRLYTASALTLVLSVTLFSKVIILKMTTVEYLSAAEIIPLIIISIFISNLNNFFPGLFIKKKTRIISVIGVFSGLLNLILNLFFIPEFGLVGAAVATLISYGFNSGLLIYLSQKEYRVIIGGLAPILMGILVLVFCMLYPQTEYSSDNNLLWQSIIFLGFTCVIALTILNKIDRHLIRDKACQYFTNIG